MKDWEEKHKDLCCKEERKIKGGAKTRVETSKEGFENSLRRMGHCGAGMSLTGCNCGQCSEKVRNMCAEVEAVCKEKLSKGSKPGKKSNPGEKGKAEKKSKSKAD